MKLTTDILDKMIAEHIVTEGFKTFTMHPKTHRELGLGNKYRGYRINVTKYIPIDNILFGETHYENE